jgi:hypothetical protein
MGKVTTASNVDRDSVSTDCAAEHAHTHRPRRPLYTAADLRISCWRHAADLRAALYRYGPPPRMQLRQAFDLISPRRARELRYVTPHARPLWQRYLHQAFGHWDTETAPRLRMLTLLNGAWHFGEHAWDFDLERIKRQIRAILAGYHYVVAIEFACFRNYRMTTGTGRIIAPHVQGLIWGDTPGLRARRAALVAGIAGADPIHLRSIKEEAGGFAGAVGYMVKPPHHGYRLWQDAHGRFHHQGEALALQRHHYLFTHLLPYDYPDLTLSGGAGVAVLRTARAAADRPFRRPQR